MKNETKLTAQDLALYLGAPCEVTYTPGGFEYYENGGTYLISGKLINEYGKGEAAVKPILRPLSDMTETEARAVWEKCYGDDFGDGECLLHLIATVDADERNDSEFDVLLGYPDGWRYLLSRHFDLFGWIAAGLAIDKTKTETK